MNGENEVILTFAKADREGIGNKARHLAKLANLQPGLFKVPPGLVLLPTFSTDTHLHQLTTTLSALAKGPFAVRSCSLQEDEHKESLAGKFHTELFVHLEDIVDAISKVRASYGDSADTSAVLIQQMIDPDYAGVVFTRSPENYGLASCEYSKGTAEAVVSGKVEPTRVDYGRWTGTLYPAQNKTNNMLSLLFLVGMIIEEKMGAPQDIEWAYDKQKGQLYILQSRDITSNLYEPGIATEQERAANFAIRTLNGQKGRTVFQNASVREVVSSPTHFTRSLIEQLYLPRGALGNAFTLLELPCPEIQQPYITSVFGQLYANVEVENKLFGFRLKMLWVSRKLKKKIQVEGEALQSWLANEIDSFPNYPLESKQYEIDVNGCAQAVMTGARTFIQEVYPIAYAATLLAQIAGEENQEASITGQMMRDLSRLHHTEEIEEFIEKWGTRSANDYELSEPRFCEAPERAVKYAINYANVSWGNVESGRSFTHFKEVAKDKAIRWLYPLRQNMLVLEKLVQLEPGQIFYLDLTDIEALAKGTLAAKEIPAICRERSRDEHQWSSINLGDKISLETLERLENKSEKQQGLRGKMVSARCAFEGVARHIDTIKEHSLTGNEVLLAKHLTPDLVGHFRKSIGCLVDMGGALSHAAIVARELDYPILVLSGCSNTIQDGDQVTVNDAGMVNFSRKKK